MKTEVLIAVLLAAVPAAAQEIRMENGRFVVSPWKPPGVIPGNGWSSIFNVYTGSASLPPIMGSYEVAAERLVFTPRFPLKPGMRVLAVFRDPGKTPIESTFEIPAPSVKASTRVVQVYPSGDILPENQLKLYVEFSAPMQRGEAWQRIRLLDAQGSVIELPFLEIEQELWDRDGKRLTVLFDPGRIKRGLFSLDEAGPALEQNRTYTLMVDRDWRDGNGVALEREFKKQFRTGPEDRDPPDPQKWRIGAPAAGTAPLVVQFPESLDYALLLHSLYVKSDAGQVHGSISIGPRETEWRFTPTEPWQAGDYHLVVDTSLEDLAGNRIGRPFDVDTFERVTKRVEQKTVLVPFRIGRQKR